MIGTTPIHTFKMPEDTYSVLKTVKITYLQNDSEILVKRTEDCDIGDGKIAVKLSQKETFLFDHNIPVQIQVRVLTLGGECVKSKKITRSVSECLDSEVLK